MVKRHLGRKKSLLLYKPWSYFTTLYSIYPFSALLEGITPLCTGILLKSKSNIFSFLKDRTTMFILYGENSIKFSILFTFPFLKFECLSKKQMIILPSLQKLMAYSCIAHKVDFAFWVIMPIRSLLKVNCLVFWTYFVSIYLCLLMHDVVTEYQLSHILKLSRRQRYFEEVEMDSLKQTFTMVWNREIFAISKVKANLLDNFRSAWSRIKEKGKRPRKKDMKNASCFWCGRFHKQLIGNGTLESYCFIKRAT